MTTILILTIFTNMTQEFNLPKDLLESLCYVESNHNTNAVHHDDGGEDSVGICQVKLSTSKWLGFKGTEKQLILPKNNIYYAAKYLSYQINRYGSVERGIVAYNRGNAINLTSSKYSSKVINRWRAHNGRPRILKSSNQPI